MKTFQEALEKRVADTKNVRLDKHTVKKATHDVVEGLFGKLGKGNVVVVDWGDGVLVLQCEKSVWRTETILNKSKIINEVNSVFGSDVVSDLRVRGV